MSTVLTPPAADERLWTRFQEGRIPRAEIAASRVLTRWQRCRDAGLEAENPGDPVMRLDGLGAAIESFGPLLAPGAPFDAFASAMAQAGFSGLFCDSEGVILAQRIAEPFRVTSVRTRLVEGADWSEGARGTNGVGTALFEAAPVSIVGAEHYEHRNHCLACFAAPIHDIRDRVVAVLDASGPVASASPFVQASVVATAAALEALIVARTYDAAIPGGLFELERLLEKLPHATLLVESTGHVRRANRRFRGILPADRGPGIARLVREQMARGHASASRTLEIPGTIRGYRVEIEPLGNLEDPFAALVHLRAGRLGARRTKPRPEPSPPFAAILGSDPAIAAARARAERFAPTDLPVLLLGETGVGKEVFARAIHAGSTRANAPFVAVNCGALAGTLLESELFGYGPGAFTGAAAGGSTGKLAAAHQGTLFLDEVGEMSPAAQSALLRFLEDGTYYRVGESAERRADVRVIAATSRELPERVAGGQFRNDLYFRLRGVVLRLPPLRERSDRRALASALLEALARARGLPKPLGLSRAALDWVDRCSWPGNVRELRTALEVALVLAGDAPRIERDHLPDGDVPGEGRGRDLRAAAERAAVARALDMAHGNLSDAARTLGVARSTLYRMMRRHGLGFAGSGGPA